METPGDRLRDARKKAGFDHAKEAAEAMGISVSTYIGHENGSRGITVPQAAKYARRFRVPEQWILYGKSMAAGEEFVPEDEFSDVVKEIPKERREEALELLKVFARRKRA